MLTIIVGPKKQNIVTADGKNMRVYPLLVMEDGMLRCFQERLNYGVVEDVEVLVMRWFLPFGLIRLRLELDILSGIVEFLHDQHAKENKAFDCYSFAALVRGLKQHSKAYLREVWDFHRPRVLPRVGDIVFFLSDKRKCFHHAAVYIGSGLYLSVYGAGGDLEVSTFKDMKKDYGADEVVRAIVRV